MNAREVEYKSGVGSSVGYFFGAVLFLAPPFWLLFIHRPPPDLFAAAPFCIFSGLIALTFIWWGLLQFTRRVRLNFVEDGVTITETTFLRTRSLKVCRSDQPEIIFDRNCTGGGSWSIKLTRPRPFLFGRNLQRDDLYEIHQVLSEVLTPFQAGEPQASSG